MKERRNENKTEEKRGRGRPPKPETHISDSFENVIQALVQPVKKERKEGVNDQESTSALDR